MSLIVALYAIKLATRQTTSPKYSYGWQRAEILGALINGVFLLALCLSIFLEAVQRFFEPQSLSLLRNSNRSNIEANILPCKQASFVGNSLLQVADDGQSAVRQLSKFC